MSGLVYKDFLLLRKQLSYILILAAFYMVLVGMGVMGAFILPGITVICSMMFPMSSFAYDDLARWDKYAASTPAGRRGVVLGKYAFTLLLVLAGGALSIALLAALRLLGIVRDPLIGLLATTGGCTLAALLVDAIVLPLLFKFGAEKSRYILMAVFIAVFGGIGGLGYLGAREGLPSPPGWVLAALPVVLPLVAAGAFVISYFLSRGVFEKKEL